VRRRRAARPDPSPRDDNGVPGGAAEGRTLDDPTVRCAMKAGDKVPPAASRAGRSRAGKGSIGTSGPAWDQVRAGCARRAARRGTAGAYDARSAGNGFRSAPREFLTALSVLGDVSCPRRSPRPSHEPRWRSGWTIGGAGTSGRSRHRQARTPHSPARGDEKDFQEVAGCRRDQGPD
jgi:hypothetical protein